MTLLPTLRQLQFLIALADHGSFSRAAEATHVTQPTLSAAIKELEAILGVVLVERGARGAVLTPAGETVLERARRVMTEAEDLVTAAQAAGEPLSGPFKLGVIPTIAPFLLPQVLPTLRSAYPDLKLYLREDLTERLMDALRERRLDAALIALPYEAALIDTHSLGTDEFMLCCSPDHPFAGRETLEIADLSEEPMLLLEDGHCLRDHVLSACSAGRARSDFAATSLHTLVQMVKSGLGVTLVPKLAVDAGLVDQMDVVLKAFNPPMIGREIGIAWRRGSARSDEARAIGESIGSLLQP
ncbi:MAG: hydrogen peroxide-inducible genes activator [Alphaproteobacteria bacterium]|nr:hydrogen peroxide-inducible genes activator [Alphaproteobacteria bacterium]